MAEEKKNAPQNELNDEKLDNVTGGTATRSDGTFYCKCCKQNVSVSKQSVDPDYCSYCYHYTIQPALSQESKRPPQVISFPFSHKNNK